MNELYAWIKPEVIASLFLIMARVSGVFIAAPLLGNHAVSPRIKIPFVIMTSLILLPMVPKAPDLMLIKSDLAMISFLVVELTIGFLLGLVAFVVFSTVQVAGEIFGLQGGLGMATIFDPANEGSAGVMTILYVIMGSFIFLYLNGHHLILGGLFRSFAIVPLGAGFPVSPDLGLVDVITKSFAIAIQISVPMLVVMTILNVVFGFLTKLSPSMNIFFNAGFIITPIVAIITLMMSLPLFRVLFSQFTEGLEPELLRMLRHMQGTH